MSDPLLEYYRGIALTPTRPSSRRDFTITDHSPPSPPSSAESYFLPSLGTNDVSAYALAASLRNSTAHSSKLSFSSLGSASACTADYASCVSSEMLSDVGDTNIGDLFFIEEHGETDVSRIEEIAETEETTHTILEIPDTTELEETVHAIPDTTELEETVHTIPDTTELEETVHTIPDTTEVMPEAFITAPEIVHAVLEEPVEIVVSNLEPSPLESTDVKSSISDPVTESKTPPLTIEREIQQEKDEEPHFDISQNLYGGVKSAWGFGCRIGVVKPFLKAAEEVAGTVLGMGGIRFDKLDEDITPKLSELDRGVLDPLIGGVVGFVTPFWRRGENAIKPMVMKMAPCVVGRFGLFEALKEDVEVEVTPTSDA